MLIYLLSLLLMAKEEPKVIDYQNVEYVQPVQQTDLGISQPKVDARVGANNIPRYLDWINWVVSQLLPIPSWPWEYNIIEWYTFTTTGKQDFTLWYDDRITIPMDWTYTINVRVIIDDLFWDLWLTKCELLKNWGYLLQEWRLSTIYYESITITTTKNFQKWDYIQLQISVEEETQNRTLNVDFTITKIS